MASTIKIKNSDTAGNSPSSLSQGEFAINVADGNLFYGDGSNVKQNFAFGEITGSNISASGTATVNTLTASGLNYPTADGEDGYVIKTDGAGNLSFDRPVVYAKVKNVSGETLSKGTPVHANGTSGNSSEVVAASASVASTMPATFVLAEDLADDAEGNAIVTGFIQGVDTSGFGEGDVVYVGGNGGYTNVKPTGDNKIQNLGIITKVHVSNGSGFIYGSGRSNDVPNLGAGKIFYGQNNQTEQVLLTDALPAGVLSGSAQIATDISGAFNATSASFSTRVTANDAKVSYTDSSSLASRLNTLETAGYTTNTGTVDTSGTPANNQIAVFTDSDTIEGDSNFTWNSTLLDLNGRLDIDYSTTNAVTSVVEINNNTTTVMSTDHFALKVAGGEANGAPSGQQKSYGGYFTAGNTNGALPDSIALYAQGHEDGAPNSYAAIFSGSTGGVVGINTLEPTVELDVIGDVKVSSNITALGDISSSGIVTANTIDVDTDIDITTNNEFLRGKLTGGATRNVIGIDDSDNVTVGNSTSDSIKLIGDVSGSGTVQLKPRLDLPKTSTTDGDYYGTVVHFGSNTSGMTAGTIYYYRNTGAWVSAQADSTTTSLGLLGVALGSAASDGVLIQGTVTLNHDPGALGDTLYLSDTNAGRATSTVPSSTNDVVRVIGYCLDASNGQIYFNPSSDHIVHA